jgi:hypothetical protein
MVKRVYFLAAGVMAVIAVVSLITLGWLWALALLGIGATLVFLGLGKDENGSAGDGHAR